MAATIDYNISPRQVMDEVLQDLSEISLSQLPAGNCES